ncbi:MAG: tRNA (adenosine(37)-N6)-dimethylallyltransferase MiaA, partial [Clostridiales bacterium]|nr:tRNA (adenosine(37)-N6)-dimethylallyltransferase MiaA [Clostridiales bacterium]
MEKIDLIVIVGPTAIGKTDLSIMMAKGLNGEIVSADSMQIYKYMNIGTAKPTMQERRGIPHHMMDIVEPDESFNVALYQKGAKDAIQNIYRNKKLPILVGGSGLYINSIVYPMDFTDATEDLEYRKYLYQLAEKEGKEYLHNKLKGIDPETG